MRRFSSRRHGRRKHKPPVKWLQDREFSGLSSIGTSVGVIPTVTLVWDNDMDQDEFDPAQAEAQAAALGGAVIIQMTPQAELREDRGWRLMRCVGKWSIALKQTSTPIETAGRAQYIKIAVGLCVLDVDDEGNFLNEKDYNLLETAVPTTPAAVADAMRGMGASWIWRREWMLQNYALNYGSGLTNRTTAAWSPLNMAETPSGDHDYYALFPANNVLLPYSAGPDFDIKRHVTLKHNQQLAWRFAAIDMQGSATSSFELLYNRSYRSLIARAGRPFRGAKK